MTCHRWQLLANTDQRHGIQLGKQYGNLFRIDNLLSHCFYTNVFALKRFPSQCGNLIWLFGRFPLGIAAVRRCAGEAYIQCFQRFENASKAFRRSLNDRSKDCRVLAGIGVPHSFWRLQVTKYCTGFLHAFPVNALFSKPLSPVPT
jgi:hypothetical protein